MEQNPAKALHRFMIILPTIFLVGLLIFFFRDKMVGGGVLAGGGIALIFVLVYYYKIKKNDPVSAAKSLSVFFISVGTVLIILALAVFIFERENFKDVIYEVGLGIILLVYGIYMLKSKEAQKTTWREIPFGMKIIIIFLSISVVLSLINLGGNLQNPNFFLGFLFQPPISMILGIIYLIIPIVVIFLICQKTGWKIVLGLQSFNFLNGLFAAIKILLTPLPQLFAMLNRPLPNVSSEVLQAAELQSKLIVSIPMFTGVIIALIILIYTYKKKEYFTNN